jgi:hypothetical protein
MMGSSTDAQREAAIKARLQAEADSIDAKTMRLGALRMAKEDREPSPIDHTWRECLNRI